MQTFASMLLLRVYLRRKTSRVPAKIYSAAVQALSIQTRRSLPAGSERRQHLCLQQHRRHPKPLGLWQYAVLFLFVFYLGGIFKVCGPEMRFDSTWKSWWNQQLFLLCCAARKGVFSLTSVTLPWCKANSCIHGRPQSQNLLIFNLMMLFLNASLPEMM